MVLAANPDDMGFIAYPFHRYRKTYHTVKHYSLLSSNSVLFTAL